MMSLMVSVGGQDEESTVSERPYTVLQKQNLLLLMIIMAVCVYKPL
uniref:Si:dkey-234h16.7 n=1 Tax=Hippocampus comes TaxID=109280 RepID=A0A3Q2XQR5_HIPCM